MKRQTTPTKTPCLSALFALVASAAVITSCNRPENAGGEAPAPSGEGDAAAYPLTTCVVSGEELGSMGEPVVIDHEGTTVKFCCKSCLPDFKADPEAYLAKLR